MTLDEFRNSLRAHFSRMLDDQKQSIRENGRLSPVVAYSMEDAVQNPYPTSFKDKAIQNLLDDQSIAEVLKKVGETADLIPETRQAFRAEYRLADKAYMQAVLQFNSTHDSYSFSEGLAATIPQLPEKLLTKGPTLSQAVADFMADAKLEKRWIAKTEGERQEHIDLMYEILGKDRLISEVGYEEARTVHKALRAYPVNRHKGTNTRDVPLADLLTMTGLRTLHPLTINKYTQTYRSLFNWAKRNGLAKANPFEGLSLRTDKVNDVDPRIPFSEAALNTIRDTLTKSGGEIPEHHKWGSLIAFYSGARLNEVAQLHLTDIREVDGIQCFDINADGPTKKLKNKHSKRMVPVHPQLIQYGIMNYIDSVRNAGDGERLFPKLTYTKSDGYGRNLGRWFNETFLPNAGLKTKRHTFHSLRHSMVERLIEAEVQQAHIMAIVGHEQDTTTLNTYNRNGFPMQQLLSALEKVS
jgi:integrase